MKIRISTLIAALALTATSAQAQWTPDDKNFNIIGTDSIYGQGGLKTLLMPDGKLVLTWTNTPKDVLYKDPSFGYYLYMQVYDKDGRPLLGKDGKVIVGNATKSWLTDYSLQPTADGNVLITYTDTRDDADKQEGKDYMYCYATDGTPVWSKDGVEMKAVFDMKQGHTYSTLEPMVCTSGSNIYSYTATSDAYKVKADESNWEPNPWFPDEEMPDSIDVSDGGYQIMRYNADGTRAWASPVNIATDNAWLYPAPDGDVYVIYVNAGLGFDARRINADGKDVWDGPVNVESGSVSGGSFTTEPTVVADGKGGLMLAYRKLLTYTGYIVANHLTPDGRAYDDELIVNGTQDGDGDSPSVAVNGDRAFVAFNYDYVSKQLWINQLDLNGDYTWEGDNLLGYAYGTNDLWGFHTVKVIPRQDGWVMLYGDIQDYSSAKFYAAKIDFDGNEVWKKQIGDDDFKSSGFSVAYDDNNAYIFYTCDKEIGDDWQEITGDGGLRMMCVDITGKNTGIESARTDAMQGRKVYNAQGMSVEGTSAPGLYIVKESGKTRKIAVK